MEVDDATFETMKKTYELVMKLNGDATSRPLLEKAIKQHFPNVTTEEEAASRLVQPQFEAFQREVGNPLMEELKALREEREANQARATEQSLNSAFDEFRTKRGLTDEGIEAVKRMMVEKSIADPYAAAALFAEQNPAPSQEAPGWTPASWNIDQSVTDHDVAGLFANEDAWADNMAAKTLNEIRVGQAA